MKLRLGFVSNSSSTGFIIINKGKLHKSLGDFVTENPQLVDKYNKAYPPWGGADPMKLEDLVSALPEYDYHFPPGKAVHCIFGDEQCNAIGRVYDYILRDGGSSANFTWYFSEYHR